MRRIALVFILATALILPACLVIDLKAGRESNQGIYVAGRPFKLIGDVEVIKLSFSIHSDAARSRREANLARRLLRLF